MHRELEDLFQKLATRNYLANSRHGEADSQVIYCFLIFFLF